MSGPSRTTGTIFLYIYIYIYVVTPCRVASKCFYAFLFRRPRGEKYRNTMLHSGLRARSPTMLKHSSSNYTIHTGTLIYTFRQEEGFIENCLFT